MNGNILPIAERFSHCETYIVDAQAEENGVAFRYTGWCRNEAWTEIGGRLFCPDHFMMQLWFMKHNHIELE